MRRATSSQLVHINFRRLPDLQPIARNAVLPMKRFRNYTKSFSRRSID